jgi:hypothetical protein
LGGGEWWAWEDSNLQPVDYEPNALTIELQARRVESYDTATGEASQGLGMDEKRWQRRGLNRSIMPRWGAAVLRPYNRLLESFFG